MVTSKIGPWGPELICIYGKKMANEYSQHNEVIILKHTVHVNQKVPNVKTENKN